MFNLLIGLWVGCLLGAVLISFCKASGRRVRAAALIVCFGLALCACQPSATINTGQPSGSGSVMQNVEQADFLIKSIRWIIPLAQGVVGIFFPDFAPEFGLAVASYNGLVSTADNLIAAAKYNPSAADPAKINDTLAQLQKAWALLDGSYRGDQASVLTLLGK